MCNCGRKKTTPVTTAQTSASEPAVTASAADQTAKSVRNAIANATGE